MPPVEIRQFPQRDTGTGKVSQRNEPETVADLSHTEAPTGVAQQQDDEVTVSDTTHSEKPTGVAKQSGPTTTRDAMTVALEEQATAGETEDEAEDEPDAKKRKGARDKARRVEE